MSTQPGIHFTLELAGCRFRVQCSYPQTKWLCRFFLTEETDPVTAQIVLDHAALEQERSAYPTPESDAGVERQCLCRQIAHHLVGQNTMLFHSSALMFDGQAVLFTAPSGTGKSTHTGLWRQVFGSRVSMINDDKPFVHLSGQTATVYGSPWQGKHNLGNNIHAPLKAVCIVTRGQENRIDRLSAREAFPLLLQQVYRPEDPQLLAGILAWTNTVSTHFPVYRLTCNLDPEAAIVACRGIFGEESTNQ